MNRRGFLKGILLAASAPAIVRVASLMPVRAPTIWLSEASLEQAIIDIASMTNSRGVLINIAPTTILWPGVKAWWDQHYNELDNNFLLRKQ